MQMGFAVCTSEHPLPGGGYLARLRLNAPAQLNALTPEMVELLYRQLQKIAADPEALGVWLDSSGERAFCVGADLRRMLDSALANPGGSAIEAEAFFTCEFELIHLLHRFPKPVICWGQGLVMGSGLSMLATASHRIVTQSSRLSMPEVGIGLLPNAGASWFLQQMPGATGLFAALTATELQAADALYAGLADYCFADAAKATVFNGLLDLEWQGNSAVNAILITEYLTDQEVELGEALAFSALKQYRRWIDDHCAEGLSVLACQLAACGDKELWLGEAAKGFDRAAVSSQLLLQRQLQQAERLTMADILRLELITVANRIRDPEFGEGVRARLIDRDRDPRWCYRNYADVPEQELTAFFTQPWEQHPLQHLS